MSLVGNYSVILKSPASFRSGSSVSDNRAAWGHSHWATTSIPSGYRPGRALVPQQKDSGDIAAQSSVFNYGTVIYAKLSYTLPIAAAVSATGGVSTAGGSMVINGATD